MEGKEEKRSRTKWFTFNTGGVDCAIECAGFEYATTMKHKVEMAVGLETDACDILTEMITAIRKV